MSFPPSAQPLTDIERVLGIFAHPDDVDFGAAATVARWAAAGIEVSYVLITRGDSGGFDATPRSDMPALREAEQRAAAAALGVTNVEFLDGYSDGSVEPTLALRRDLTRVIRHYRPDRILTNSPLRRYDRITGPSHPDHLAAGEATTQALYPYARNEFAYPEFLEAGLKPWVVREIWYSGGPNPDIFIDATDYFEHKLAALRAHTSQTSHMDIEAMMRARMTDVARLAGLPEGRLAETFNVFRTE